ncbi:MAG: anthrone oxygenase family protein [Burkholderiaceae bacterium]
MKTSPANVNNPTPVGVSWLGGATVLLITFFGLMAGFFYAYSVSVMPGLDASSPGVAIEAMQGINREVRNLVFLTTFMFTPVAAGILATGWLMRGQARVAAWLAAALVAYGLGVVLTTSSIHVPMNDALAVFKSDVGPQIVAEQWQAYSVRWTKYNHLRALSSAVAMLLTVAGLIASQRRVARHT